MPVVHGQVVVDKSVDMVDMGHGFPNCSVDLGGWVWCVLLGNFVVIGSLEEGFVGALVGGDVVFEAIVGAFVGDDVVFTELVGATFSDDVVFEAIVRAFVGALVGDDVVFS